MDPFRPALFIVAAALAGCVTTSTLARGAAAAQMGCDGTGLVVEQEVPAFDPAGHYTKGPAGARFLAAGCGQLGRYWVQCSPLKLLDNVCANDSAARAQGFLLSPVLKARAAKDLACGEDGIELSRLRTHQNFHYLARGCGHAARYEIGYCPGPERCHLILRSTAED